MLLDTWVRDPEEKHWKQISNLIVPLKWSGSAWLNQSMEFKFIILST